MPLSSPVNDEPVAQLVDEGVLFHLCSHGLDLLPERHAALLLSLLHGRHHRVHHRLHFHGREPRQELNNVR